MALQLSHGYGGGLAFYWQQYGRLTFIPALLILP